MKRKVFGLVSIHKMFENQLGITWKKVNKVLKLIAEKSGKTVIPLPTVHPVRLFSP